MKKLIVILILLVGRQAWAAEYFAATTGNNGFSCAQAQSTATPKRTIVAAIGCMAGGDTVTVLPGTYLESAGFFLNVQPPNGTAAAPSVLRAQFPRTVIWRRGVSTERQFTTYNIQHLVIDGLDIDGQSVGAGDYATGIQIQGISTGVTIRNMYFHHMASNCLGVDGAGTSGIVVEDSEFDHCGYNPVAPGYGLYTGASGTIFRRNLVHHSGGFGAHFHDDNFAFDDILVDSNIFHSNSQFVAHGSVVITRGGRGKIINNVMRDETNVGVQCGGWGGTCLAWNNTLYNVGRPAQFDTNSANNEWKNNLILSSGSSVLGSATTAANITSSSPATYVVNAAGGDLRLIAGSPAADAGASLGPACNGGCAVGAFDPPEILNVEVGTGGANKVRVTFDNDAAQPLQAASLTAGWSNLKAGANNPIISGTLFGNAVIEFTVQSDFTSTDGCSVSYVQAAGNLTDSAAVGGTWNQPFHSRSNVPCTNNVTGGGGAAPVLSQITYRVRELYGSESAAGWKAPENTPYDVIVGGAGRIRIKGKAESADPPAFNVGFEKRLTLPGGSPGAKTPVIDSCSATEFLCFYGTATALGVAHNTPTTEQLTSTLANTGCFVLLQNSTPSIDPGINTEWECEIAFKFDPSLPKGAKVELFMTRNGGAAFEVYSQIATLNVIDNQFIQDAKLEPKDVNLNVGQDWNFRVTRRTSDTSPTVTFSVPKSARVRVNGVMQ